MYDVIIIGAGPAGISASLYAKRGNLKVLNLYSNNSSLEKTNLVENYYGFEHGINGQDLYCTGIKQAENIGIQIKKEEVVKLEINNNNFKVYTNKDEYICKSLIFATGSKKNKPKISGVEKFEGKGVSYCAICDGFFYKNKNVAVLGNGNYAISEVNDLLNITNNITILTNGSKAPEFRNDNVNINTKEIENIDGNKKVEKIQFRDGSTIDTDGIFIAQGVAESLDFAKKLGIITNNNKITVNENMETNIKGIYACGDCTGGLLQISKAVYEGTKAGLQVIDYIRKAK